MNTIWAMKSIITGGWLRIDAGQAVAALESGAVVRLMSASELPYGDEHN